MNEGSAQRHTSSTTITPCAFTFDRPSNGIFGIYRDPLLYTLLVIGPRPTEEEVEGASTTRKEGMGDGGTSWFWSDR